MKRFELKNVIRQMHFCIINHDTIKYSCENNNENINIFKSEYTIMFNEYNAINAVIEEDECFASNRPIL